MNSLTLHADPALTPERQKKVLESWLRIIAKDKMVRVVIREDPSMDDAMDGPEGFWYSGKRGSRYAK